MRRGPIPYSAAEMVWLEANFRLVISDYHAAFLAAFGRSDVTASHLNQLRKRKGWKVGRDGARYKGRRRIYSDAEIAWLRDHASLPLDEVYAEFQKAFGRPDVTPDKLHSLRKREGIRTGRTGRFEKGMAPANKGQRCKEGRGGRHPNARRSQFKKGQLPHNTKYLGHERVSKDGYVEISIDEVNPHTGYERRYVLKHRHLWEKQHGPLPEGMCLKCLDGNRLNTDPSNWEPIPRGALPLLSARFGYGFDQAPAEVKPVLMNMAKLKHKAKAVIKARKEVGKSCSS